MPQDSATVWVVRAGERDAARASLSIEDRAVVIHREGEDALRLSGRRITNVRRQRGSPVLLLQHLDAAGEERLLLLYFRPPPPLPEPGTAALLRPRGLERTAGVIELRAANRQLKAMVKEWLEAIREVAGGAD